MNAAILYADRDIRPGTAPEPSIRPNGILIETAYADIYSTYLHIFRGAFERREIS